MRGLPCASCGRHVGANYVRIEGKLLCGPLCNEGASGIEKDKPPADVHAVQPEAPDSSTFGGNNGGM